MDGDGTEVTSTIHDANHVTLQDISSAVTVAVQQRLRASVYPTAQSADCGVDLYLRALQLL